jgi:transposase
MESMKRAGKSRQARPEVGCGVVVGIDVSKRWIDYGAFRWGEKAKITRVTQNAAGFGELGRELEALRAQGAEVWVALEPTGPYGRCLLEWLAPSGWRVVQVNPYHVKRTREVRDNNPGCSDRKACRVIADLVWSGCYQSVIRLEGSLAELRVLSGEWESLSKKHTGVNNEFQARLTVWFPELGDIFRDALCKSIRGIVRDYASPRQVAQVGLARVRKTLSRATKGRMVSKAGVIQEAARQSVGLRTAAGECREGMLTLLELAETIERRQAQVRAEFETRLAKLPEAQALLSLPDFGVVGAAGLLGDCGALGSFSNYHQVEKHLGLNLCRCSSGLRQGRYRISKRGRSRARHLLCYLASKQCKAGGLYYEFAAGLKAKGKSAKEIRVAVARKLLRLLFALARDRAIFDPQRFAADRTEHGQPIQQEMPLAA